MREYEDKLNLELVAGVDEAGRGPVAGPVVAACVILPKGYINNKITDSKKLSKKQLLVAYEEIIRKALSIGISVISHERIDQINILEATKEAMLDAINKLSIKPEHILIDAVKLNHEIASTSIIKGDLKSITIPAASIIAKVTRDNIMIDYDKIYPLYLFKNHKGYLTKNHRQSIIDYGPCAIHRKTFAPISNYYK